MLHPIAMFVVVVALWTVFKQRFVNFEFPKFKKKKSKLVCLLLAAADLLDPFLVENLFDKKKMFLMGGTLRQLNKK